MLGTEVEESSGSFHAPRFHGKFSYVEHQDNIEGVEVWLYVNYISEILMFKRSK